MRTVRFLLSLGLLAAVMLAGCPEPKKARQVPKVYTVDGEAIAAVRARAQADDPTLQPALEALRKRAEAALVQPVAEIASKPRQYWAKSGDPKDYISVSKFAWPDPADSSKWIMIDGKPNEEAMKNFDGPKMKAMQDRVTALGEGWYFLGDRRYAKAAAEQLRAWFLDPRTGMNPNMNYGQAVSPEQNGNAWGIIDANRFPEVLNSVGMIADSGEWTPEDDAALQAWFGEFNRWLVESQLGKAERAAKNNHGTFYDLILASGAAYAGDEATVREVLTAVGPVRLAGQIAPDGSTPEETRRAESAMYTLWNLKGLADLALMGTKYGVNLWNYPDADNAKLKKAGEFLLPYATGAAEWTFGQQRMQQKGPLGYIRAIAPYYDEPRFDEAIAVMVLASNPDEIAADGSVLSRPWPEGQEPWVQR